jgi:6,7-dimethyl-8-ribityllumazine synthase
MADRGPHILIFEARFYEAIADELLRGAVTAIEGAGATYDRLGVPGALELPAALAMALQAEGSGGIRYDGFVILGCVIRGETTHYDIVCNESARAIMDLAVDEGLALGFCILTVENEAQAWVRARVDDKNKGGGAAEAALAMIALRKQLGLQTGR